MLVAVLKNRLLQLTDRSFREQDYGASSLLELMPRYRDLVTIDRTVKPIVIEWIGSAVTGPTNGVVGRVRPDLWRATLDFSSGFEYEWDVEVQQARPVPEADPQRRLPTVNLATLAEWRTAFVVTHEPTLSDPEDRQRLHDWANHALGSQGLPRALRSPWNEHLKHAVVVRLTRWFESAGRQVPDIM